MDPTPGRPTQKLNQSARPPLFHFAVAVDDNILAVDPEYIQESDIYPSGLHGRVADTGVDTQLDLIFKYASMGRVVVPLAHHVCHRGSQFARRATNST